MNVDSEIKITKEFLDEARSFTLELEKVISQYFGFNVTFPLEEQEENLIINAKVDYPITIPAIQKNITSELIKQIVILLDSYSEEYGYIHPNILHTIPRDLSFSYIFDGYLELDPTKQYEFIKKLKELIHVGAQTYEGKAVDIGVIYCSEEQNLNEIKKLDLDIVTLPHKKSIYRFFMEEKPFLRLIDNKSLAVAVDNELNVFAIVRKKLDGKSLSHILESQFNDWIINNATIAVLHDLITFYRDIELVDKIFETLHSTTGVTKETIILVNEAIADILLDIVNGIQPKQPPKYKYFSIHDKNLDIFTQQPFTISYIDGEWKLKHYNLMLSILMMLLLPQNLFFESDNDMNREDNDVNREFKEVVNDLTNDIMNLTKGITKLSHIIRRISQNSNSSIFVIPLKQYGFNALTPATAKEILKDNGFANNNLEKDFLNIIRNDGYHLNIKNTDHYLIETIAAVDGAVILDTCLNIVSFGEVIDVPGSIVYDDTFGTGTKAARYASRLGIAIKISEDGDIYIFYNQKLLLKI
jgi:hypothetical protein